MKAISTFAKSTVTPDYQIKSFDLYTDPEFEFCYDYNDSIVSNWATGEDIYIRVELVGNPSSDSSIIINWYCPETHIRGAVASSVVDYDHNLVILTGKFNGAYLRKTIDLNFQLLNVDGFVISTFYFYRIILEGKKSFFPVGYRDFSSNKDAFCCVEMSIDTHPEELFSQTICKAVINKKSGIYLSNESKISNYIDTNRFLMYETWRQKLEIALNNENFEEFMAPESNDDMRIGVIWSNLLTKIFPGYSLNQIRSLRNENYADFCAAVQSHFFTNYTAYI